MLALTINSYTSSAELPKEHTNSIGMKFNLIPAGTFMMGSSMLPEETASVFLKSVRAETLKEAEAMKACDREAFRGEHPQHRVRITQPFYLGVFEVTQGEWAAVMGTYPWRITPYAKDGLDYPASCVSWGNAVAFCEKLTGKEGVTYRLPTEAEWEYACRAGTVTEFHFGDDVSQLGDYAWFDANTFHVDEKHAHKVGQKKCNLYGLYDMYGNVWEWCSDWYDSDYYANSPTDDPAGPYALPRMPGPYQARVLRGGSWYDHAARCRSAYRLATVPGFYGFNFGFRVAKDAVVDP